MKERCSDIDILEEVLDRNQYYIDKTKLLEQEILRFPALYIEGAAASGKTTAVRILLKHHSEVEARIFAADRKEEFKSFFEQAEEILKKMQDGSVIWVVFENIPGKISDKEAEQLVQFVRDLPEACRVLITGRENPPIGLLELLWKREMNIWGQERLCLTKEEIGKLAERLNCRTLNAEEVYEATGGWAGCVEVMLRIAANKNMSVSQLRKSYEIHSYIHTRILEGLSSEECRLMKYAGLCPWLSMELCREFLDIPQVEKTLEQLTRKGFLVYERETQRWKIAPLFSEEYFEHEIEATGGFWKYLGDWYELHGFIREMLECRKHFDDKEGYRDSLKAHYEKIPFSDLDYSEVMQWKDESPQVCYLRGMYCLMNRKITEGRREMEHLKKYAEADPSAYGEIYLNLEFANPELSLESWLLLLEKYGSENPAHLYGILGNSFSYLCGLRDLSGLFACPKRDENRKAKLWKKCLGEKEQIVYQLARIEFYLETDRKDSISDEDYLLARQIVYGSSEWQFRLALFYILCKLQKIQYEEERETEICMLENGLLKENHSYCVKSAEAIGSFFSLWRKKPERFTGWMRKIKFQSKISESSKICMAEICFHAKVYVLREQFSQAEKLLTQIVSYTQAGIQNRFLAEALFMEAVVCWKRREKNQALQKAIASFIANVDTRYVRFYTEYGTAGLEVLEYYVEWIKSASPGWLQKKKKYNYGNVLHMPFGDYMERLLRNAKHETKNEIQNLQQDHREKFTMMEIILLENIGRGLTNAEICEELGLKLPTVKGHLYNLYKKLGVNSRGQAVIKGNELGILER